MCWGTWPDFFMCFQRLKRLKSSKKNQQFEQVEKQKVEHSLNSSRPGLDWQAFLENVKPLKL